MATNYSESTSGTLPFYNTAVEELLKKGQTQMGTGLGAPPPAMTLAGFSPLQQQAFAQTQAGVGAYQPLLNQSQQAIQASIAGSQFNPSQFQQFMNPYTSGVVDEIGRLGQERFQQEILPSLSNSFGGLGQFGSARQATMMADAAGRSQREVLGQQSQALNTGYNQSMDDYYNWAGLGVGANQQAGTQFGNLAQAQQNLNLGDVGALSAAGQQQQAFAQKQADLPLANWQQQQQYPWEQINQWANLFKVPAPQQNTQWQTSFKKGGLARFADGGRFPEDDPGWMIEPAVQEERDGRRIDVLLNELRLNPFDNDLKMELLLAGVPTEDIELTAQMADAHSANPWDEAGVVPPSIQEMAAQFTSPQIPPMAQSAPLDPTEDLGERAMRMREEFTDRARNSPMLSPREDRSIGEHLGEAMFRAGAEGPAHWGQLLGRTGKGYYDIERADEAENQARALSALKLEEQALPNIPAALLRGKQPSPEQLRTVYASARNEAAQIAKRMDWGTGTDAGTRAADWIEKYANRALNNYIDNFATHPIGPRGTAGIAEPVPQPLEQGAPAGAQGAAPVPVPTQRAPTTPAFQPAPRNMAEEARKKEFATGTEEMYMKDYQESVKPGAIAAEGMLNTISALAQVPRTQDKFAPFRQTLGSVFDALGLDGNLAREARNLQQVRPLLTKLANDRLLLAKGVQTEGDAQRAFDEFARLDDTQEAVNFMLAWSEELARRAKFKDEIYRKSAETKGTWGAGKDDWAKSDYGQTAPVARIDGDTWTFTDFRTEFAKANPEATIQDVIQEWNKLSRRE